MTLEELFHRCLNADYVHVENSGDYAIERDRDTLYIYLEHSNGNEDWKNNLDFPARPYKRMGKTAWYAHRGFLRVWKSVEESLADVILTTTASNIVVAGYSHGGALAVLCHEYIWFNRPDMRKNLLGFGFGAPRVIWKPNDGIKERWRRFTLVRNPDDAVTHLPPEFLGYRHVGNILNISEKGSYSPIDAHREENILKSLTHRSEVLPSR